MFVLSVAPALDQPQLL